MSTITIPSGARRHRCAKDFEAAVADGLATLPRDVNWLAALSSAVEACVLLKDTDRARELKTLLEPYAARMVVAARGAGHAGSVADFAARVAALCGDSARDQLFADAACRDEHAGATALVVRDLRRRGESLRAAGQNDPAEELLRAAARKAHSLGFDAWSSDSE